MRIHVVHATSYNYELPARYVIQKLRLTPRSHDGQHVRRWRIEVDQDCKLIETADAFGNIVHTFTLTGAVERLKVIVEGEIETEDTSGVIHGAVERIPRQLYLRETDLTEPDDAIAEFAASFAAPADERLDALHRLMASLNTRMRFDVGGTDSKTTAVDAFTLGHGVCQDFTHVFLSAARVLGIPARYVGGYLMRSDGQVDQDAGHAWAEAWIDDLGWVGFDPTNAICVTESYVRVAIGLDYLGAAPVRGAQSGGVEENLDISLQVRDVAVQQ